MDLVAARGYFFCRYCGSFHFPETAGSDGVRVLGDREHPLSCPACGKSLAAGLIDETHRTEYCRNCRGILLSRKAFAAVVEKRRAWATDPPGPPVPLNRKELDRIVICPSCKAKMAVHPYYGPGNVIIDSCEACALIWLDFGELRQIVNAPGRDRGSRELVPKDSSDDVLLPAERAALAGDDDVDPLDLLLGLR